jgi:hypothetical protein
MLDEFDVELVVLLLLLGNDRVGVVDLQHYQSLVTAFLDLPQDLHCPELKGHLLGIGQDGLETDFVDEFVVRILLV